MALPAACPKCKGSHGYEIESSYQADGSDRFMRFYPCEYCDGDGHPSPARMQWYRRKAQIQSRIMKVFCCAGVLAGFLYGIFSSFWFFFAPLGLVVGAAIGGIV